MPDTKQELDLELERLTQLAARAGDLPVDEADRELIQELIQQHADQVRSTWLKERVDGAVALLYPSYRKHLNEADKPLRWPVKDWWWNGARVTDLTELANGDVRVDLRSYVGCGETDDIEGMVLPHAWLVADDPESVVLEACRQERARLATAARAQELAQAQREAVAAAARLAQLQGGGHAA